MIERATRLAGANIEHPGPHNVRVVLRVIRAEGPITRLRIAAHTGLNHGHGHQHHQHHQPPAGGRAAGQRGAVVRRVRATGPAA